MRPLGALLLAWGLFVVYGTLLPFDFQPDAAGAASRLASLGAELTHRHSRADLASNVLLFLPWGLLFAARRAAAGQGILGAVAAATLSGALLSASVECAQLFLPSRTTSFTDVAMNAAGAALGAWPGWALVRWAWPAWSPSLRRLVSLRPLGACALTAAAGLALSGLAPFSVSIDVGSLRQAVKQARIVPFGPLVRGPAPPADPWGWLQEALCWGLMGGLVAVALRETRRKGLGSLAMAVVLCGGLALAIETAQILIVARRADATSVVLAVIGATLGAMGPCLSRHDDPARWIPPALATWVLAVVLAAWSPFRLRPYDSWSIGPAQVVPFWSYYRKTDLNALADLFDQVASYVPAGILVAAAGPRHAVRAAVVLGAGLALVLEFGQLGMAGRTAELTDVISAAGGAWLGAWVWAWGQTVRTRAAGHIRYGVRRSD